MEGFYANLLTRNIALGGSLDSAVSAYTVGSVRNTSLLQTEIGHEISSSSMRPDTNADGHREGAATSYGDTEPSMKPEQLPKIASLKSDNQLVEKHENREESSKPSPVCLLAIFWLTLIRGSVDEGVG